MIFDLQRFGGGKGGVTYQTQSYEPTAYELKLQELQAGFVEEIMPNAKDLNTIAKKLLIDSIGDSVLNFEAHLNEAHQRYTDAYENLFAGAEWISNYLNLIDEKTDEFYKANQEYGEALAFGWDSTFYKENGEYIKYPGFFDFAAHLLYDHTELAMDEIATTLRAVSNGINIRYNELKDDYRNVLDETRLSYKKILKNTDGNVTFESVASDNVKELENISKSLKSTANE